MTTAIIAETQIDAFPSTSLASSFVRFRLRLPPVEGSTVPQASGSTITVTATTAAGSISQALWPNSAISVTGNFYTVEIWSNGRITSSANYLLNSSVDLSNATPITGADV